MSRKSKSHSTSNGKSHARSFFKNPEKGYSPENYKDNINEQPINVEAETQMFTEVRMLREWIGYIKQQNWNLEMKISSLSDKVSQKFDRWETRMSTRNDEIEVLKRSLFQHQSKVSSAIDSMKIFVFVIFSLVVLYGYLEMVAKPRFDWSKMITHYYNLYKSFT